MTSPSIQQNIVPSKVDVADLLNLFRKDLLLNLNCHHIGTIKSFDPTKQTATATINYKKSFLVPNNRTGAYETKLVDYPIPLDSPVIFLGGGLGSLTFPVTSGDECLILFNDRDMDGWFQGNNNAPVSTPRLHSFSDAIILVGLRSQPNVITDFNNDGVELRYGPTKITLTEDSFLATVGETGVTLEVSSDGKLKITNLTGEFVASLVQLMTDIQTGLVSTLLGPQPLVMPNFAADLLTLQSFQG